MPNACTTRLLKAGVGGVAATIVDVLVLVMAVEACGVYVTIAAFFAAMIGGVTNFLINKFWTFRDCSKLCVKQVTFYAIVSLGTALFVATAVHVFAILLGWSYLLAKALAAVLVFLAWGYPAQAKFVFPRKESVPAARVAS